MKFKLDENMPASLGELLRANGHDAADVADEGLGGEGDPVVLQAAMDEGRILLTFDMDFADVRRYAPGTHAGIVVFRLRDQRWSTLKEPASRLLEIGGLSTLDKGLAIVDETRVRWRRPKDKRKR